jgi:hypothetical protein
MKAGHRLLTRAAPKLLPSRDRQGAVGPFSRQRHREYILAPSLGPRRLCGEKAWPVWGGTDDAQIPPVLGPLLGLQSARQVDRLAGAVSLPMLGRLDLRLAQRPESALRGYLLSAAPVTAAETVSAPIWLPIRPYPNRVRARRSDPVPGYPDPSRPTKIIKAIDPDMTRSGSVSHGSDHRRRRRWHPAGIVTMRRARGQPHRREQYTSE